MKQITAWVNSASMKTLLLSLAIITVLTHAVLVPIGLSLTTAEWGIFALVADEFRQGVFHPYPMGQDYGGLAFTALRALFCAIYEAAFRSSQSHMSAHMVFSYIVTPVLMTWSSFWLVASFASRRAALLVGLIAAVGFHFWVLNFGNDFYPFYFMLGCLLLSLRARCEQNPLVELPIPYLFVASFLSGLIHYTTPAALVFVAACFLPVRLIAREIKNLARSNDRWNRRGIGMAITLVALGGYLYIFNRELGLVGGRMLKLDAEPNFKIAFFLVVALCLRSRSKEIAKWLSRGGYLRMACVVTGYGLGFLPELLFRFSAAAPANRIGIGIYEFETALRVVARVPDSLRTLVAGDLQVGSIASVVLAVGSLVILARRSLRDARLEPVATLGVCATLAYCTIRSYVIPIAPARYLFPLMPAILVAIGVACDELSSATRTTLGRRRWVLSAFLGLVVLHSVHQLQTRMRVVHKAKADHTVENMFRVIEVFRATGVQVVLSDAFMWFTNAHTLASAGHPWFWAGREREWGPDTARVLAYSERRAGILLAHSGETPWSPLGETTFHGQNWKLRYLNTIGDRDLYEGTRMNH